MLTFLRRRATASFRLAAVTFLTLTGGIALPLPSMASEATGLTLTVVGDDTSTLVSDTSATNGIVPAGGGAITYQWGWSDPGGTSATFSQTLPAGMEWGDESVVSGCSRTGTIDTGQTLTCTISGLSGIGVTNKLARVYSIANGTTIISHLASGSQTSADATVTVAATPNVNFGLLKSETGYYDATDPDTPNTEAGLKIPFTFAFWTTRTSTDGAKGSESLQGPISFTVSIPSGAKLSVCSTGPEIRSEPYPLPSTSASTSSAYVPYSGAISCSQAGTNLSISLSGTDTSFKRFPLVTKNGVSIPNSGPGYFAVAGFYLWMPLSSFNTSTSTDVPISISGVTLTTLSGQTRTTPAASATWPIKLETLSLKNVNSAIGGHGVSTDFTSNVQNATVYPGETFTSTINLYAPVGTGTNMTNVSSCGVWDTSKSTILNAANPVVVSSSTISPAPTASDITVEYGTASYADEAARKAADCGSVGDGNPSWYASISAAAASPGGLASVSAIRVRYSQSFGPSKALSFQVSLVASSDPGLPNLTKIPYYSQSWSDQTAVTKSTWILDGGAINPIIGRLGSGTQGVQATLSSASVRVSQSLSTATVKPGNSVTVTMQPDVRNPIVTDGRLAQNVVVRATLPDGCFTFVPGATAPDTLTPATPATPGAGQTCKDVAGQVAYWNLGDVATTPGVTETAISYGMNLSISAPTPYTATSSAYITSDSDLIISTSRGYASALTVSAVSELSISLTASMATATQGQQVIYRMNWSNGLPDNLGQAWIADVLPYNGDGRGTSGLAALSLQSVTTSPSGLAVYYSTDSAATVRALLNSDPSGSTGITWTGTKPASGITAVRVRTQALAHAGSGYADIALIPGSLAKGGAIGNTVYGKADGLDNSAMDASPTTLSSTTAMVSGTVRLDRDYSGGITVSDLPLSGGTLVLSGYAYGPNGIDNGGGGDDVGGSLSAITDADGGYRFSTAPGSYSLSASPYQTVSAPVSPFAVASMATVSGKDLLVRQSLGAPNALADSLAAYPGGTVTVSVLMNDTLAQPDVPGPATTVTAVSQPAAGSVTIVDAASGIVSYAADGTWPTGAGEYYDDGFTYTITNAAGSASTANVDVRVYCLPLTLPDSTAVASTFATALGNLTENDSGYLLAIDADWPPATDGSGSAFVRNGNLVFVPGTHAWADDEASYAENVSYRVRDGFGNTSMARAYLNVYRGPVTRDDSVSIDPGSQVTVDVSANDTAYALPARLGPVSPPASILAAVTGDAIRVTVPQGAHGNVRIYYALTDRLGQTATGVLTVGINDISDETGSGPPAGEEPDTSSADHSPSPSSAAGANVGTVGSLGSEGVLVVLAPGGGILLTCPGSSLPSRITLDATSLTGADLSLDGTPTSLGLVPGVTREATLDCGGDVNLTLESTAEGSATIRISDRQAAREGGSAPNGGGTFWRSEVGIVATGLGLIGSGILLIALVRRRKRR